MAKEVQIADIKKLLKPSKVFIPLASTNSKYYDLFVEIGETVMVGEKIAERYGEQRTPIFSSVSGKVVGIEAMEYYSGILVDHMVIENDRKDEEVEFKPMEGLETAKNIQTRIESMGVRGLDQSGLYTRFDFTKTIKHVFVNAVFQNQAFLNVENDLYFDEMDEIIEGMQLLKKASLSQVTVIVDHDLHTVKFQEAGFDVVKVKPNVGKPWLYNAMKKVVGKDLPYNLMEEGVLFTPIHSCKAIYDAVRLGRPVTHTRLVLMCADLDSSTAFDVKLGTHIRDIMHEMGKEYEEAASIFTGSVLNGFTMKSNNFAVSEHISSVGVVNDEMNEEVCIKCGLCNDICPVGILPQNIMDAELRMVEERLYEYNLNQCIECGLCSYTCPSEINVLEWVRRAKRRVSRG